MPSASGDGSVNVQLPIPSDVNASPCPNTAVCPPTETSSDAAAISDQVPCTTGRATVSTEATTVGALMTGGGGEDSAILTAPAVTAFEMLPALSAVSAVRS